jgi:hypothetical protein
VAEPSYLTSWMLITSSGPVAPRASIAGGFFAIAKPPAAILPRTGRKLFTKREATYVKRLLAGCTPAALRGLGAIRGLTSFGAGVVLRLSASDTHRLREPGGGAAVP